MRLSATDLANHLGCHHLTSLDLAVAVGTRSAPMWHSPDLWVLQERSLMSTVFRCCRSLLQETFSLTWKVIHLLASAGANTCSDSFAKIKQVKKLTNPDGV